MPYKNVKSLLYAFMSMALALLSACQKNDTPVAKDHFISAGDSTSAGIYHSDINRVLKGMSDTCNVDIDKGHTEDFVINLITSNDSSGQGYALSVSPLIASSTLYFCSDAMGNPLALPLDGVIADSSRWVNGSSGYMLAYISEQIVSGKHVYSSLGNWAGKPDAYLGFKIADSHSGYTYLGWLQITSGNTVKNYGYIQY